MSKYLVKILAICAFAILLPLVVVGAALCVTEARGVTLEVAFNGEKGTYWDAEQTETKVAIYIDGVKQEKSKITVKKNTDVTVTYEAEGYDFQGWYEGNYSEINRETAKAASTDASYTFTVRGNLVMTAIRDIKKFNVTYTGFYDDGETAVNVEGGVYEYNQPLAALSATDPVAVAFTGWNDVNSAEITGTTRAKFAVAGNDITVQPVWSNQMFIKYYAADGETVIATGATTEATFTTYALLTSTDEVVANALTRGYAFAGWLYGDAVINAIPEFKAEGYDLVLQENLKTFNINVKYNAVNDQVDTITYNIVDGYSAYDTTSRTGYDFVGFKYNDAVYEKNGADYVCNGATLSSEIITGASVNVSVTAVWECKYLGFILDVSAMYQDGNAIKFAKANDGIELTDAEITLIDVTFEDTDTGYDLTDDIYEILTNKFSSFVKRDETTEITYNGSVRIILGHETARLSEAQTGYTFNNLIAKLLSEHEQSQFDGEQVKVQFMYA